MYVDFPDYNKILVTFFSTFLVFLLLLFFFSFFFSFVCYFVCEVYHIWPSDQLEIHRFRNKHVILEKQVSFVINLAVL